MKKTGGIKKLVLDYPAILFVLVTVVLSVLFVPYFVSEYNIKNLCLQMCDLLIIACGLTFTELNASTDFSCTSVLAVSSMTGAYIMAMSPLESHPLLAVAVAILAMLLIGVLFGLINSFAIIKLKMPAFIATMATMLIGSAFAYWFASRVNSGKTSIGGLPAVFVALGGSGRFFLVPIVITAVMWFLADFILTKTKLGRDIYAVGTNPTAAFISGVSVKKTIFWMFMLTAVFSSVESIILTARSAAGMSGLGSTMFINIVSAVIIGGTSVSGGFGGVRQTLLGALFIVIINNAMNLIGIEWYTIMLCQGLLILAATVIDYFIKKSRMLGKGKT